MKTIAFACLVALVKASHNTVEAVEDQSIVSLLQHSVSRTFTKISEPPPDAVERIRARRQARRSNPNFSVASDAQRERRRARRAAKRQAHAEGKAAGQRHFDDSGSCDICLAKCEEVFNDVFKQCMIDRECRPWQKEDGPTSDKCMKRCERASSWQRTPCNRNCVCDADNLALYEAKAETVSTVQSDWAGGRHRCRSAELGQISNCQAVAEDRESRAYDSIHKCANAAEEAGADTFNFYRTAKEYGKCDLKNCGSADLLLITAPAEPEVPAGRGNWKVFSTYCDAPPPDAQRMSGENLDSES